MTPCEAKRFRLWRSDMNRSVHVVLRVLLLGVLTGLADGAERRLGYINELPAESPEDAKVRHERVAAKRHNVPLIVHRGFKGGGPENTLEAYQAAVDLGAEGVEIDIHRTKDGVLVLHHDSDLGKIWGGNQDISKSTYYELLEAEPRKRSGQANKETRIPTLVSFLQLAREQAILIHLDVKQKDVQDDIIKLFEAADMWDHLTEVNGGNADKIRPDTWNEGKPGVHNKVKLIPFAQNLPVWPGPEEEVIATIRKWMPKPGDNKAVFISKEPEIVAKAMRKKKAEKPTPIPKHLRAWWGPEGVLEEAGSP